MGRGLVGIDELKAGDEVTAEQMQNLYGAGRHPVTGDALGLAFRVYSNQSVEDFRAEVGQRVGELDDPTPAAITQARNEVGHEWFVRDNGREPKDARELARSVKRYSTPRQSSVAGWDLTFTPAKSVSALWAVAPAEVAKQIEAAHDEAVAEAIRFLEDHGLFTREGKDGVRQVEMRGLIAAAFLHRDSRAGDPNLHTHVPISNKVQTLEDKWLSIYSKVLHEHLVATSEAYNTALEYHLTERLGIEFIERWIGPGKRAVREIYGVDPRLCELWSSRRTDITAQLNDFVEEFTEAHGRAPSDKERIKLAQQANLQTRQPKHEPLSEAEQRTQWRAEAERLLGSEGVAAMLRAAPGRAGTPIELTPNSLADTAQRVIGTSGDMAVLASVRRSAAPGSPPPPAGRTACAGR